jgi:hypothetical protein
MLLVETYLQQTTRKGIGLFARNLIPAGTTWWVRSETFDRIVTPLQFVDYAPIQQIFIETYGCLEETGNWYLYMDDSRFVNHSDKIQSYNTFDAYNLLQGCTFIRDILPNEEIVCDYREYCCKSKDDLGFINQE